MKSGSDRTRTTTENNSPGGSILKKKWLERMTNKNTEVKFLKWFYSKNVLYQ